MHVTLGIQFLFHWHCHSWQVEKKTREREIERGRDREHQLSKCSMQLKIHGRAIINIAEKRLHQPQQQEIVE